MKTLSPWAALILLGTAGPALACSPRLSTFSKVVDDAEFAFYGRAKVRITGSSALSGQPEGEEGARVVAGEVRFTGIDCYAPPRGERCPRSLTVPFSVLEGGQNCPSWVLWYNPRRERYFTLWRDHEGRWQLGGAWRSFDRPS